MEAARRCSDGSGSKRRSFHVGSRRGTVKEEERDYRHLGSLDELLSIVSTLGQSVNCEVLFLLWVSQ